MFILIIFLGINVYSLVTNWEQGGFFGEETAVFTFSALAAFLGIILVFVMNTWSKIGLKK